MDNGIFATLSYDTTQGYLRLDTIWYNYTRRSFWKSIVSQPYHLIHSLRAANASLRFIFLCFITAHSSNRVIVIEHIQWKPHIPLLTEEFQGPISQPCTEHHTNSMLNNYWQHMQHSLLPPAPCHSALIACQAFGVVTLSQTRLPLLLLSRLEEESRLVNAQFPLMGGQFTDSSTSTPLYQAP